MADTKFCHACGAQIDERAEICPKCGVRQPITAIMPMGGKNHFAAVLLALFLGGLGVHKFYLGQVVWGVVYLLFCWTFVPVLIGIIESIMLMVMSDTEFHYKYNPSLSA
ncbi:MAG: NINE protein [Myxococcales bacterium]|nr:MAG: NINE protein [Myxococcales bacterium]